MAAKIGFVLINTKAGKEREVYDELVRLPEVVECHPLFGEYDIIAKIQAEEYNKLGEIIVDKIRKVPGVMDTRTLTGISA